jgi:hypothetical protein
MLRYRLRTLLIVLAIGPPMVAGLWFYSRDLLLFALEVVLPLLAVAVGILAVAGVTALALIAILAPGIIVFYVMSAVIRLFTRVD